MNLKKGVILLSCICLILGMCGCTPEKNTNMSYTFELDTGNEVKLTLDTTEGHELTSEVPFSIMYNDEILSQGSFVKSETFGQYKVIVEEDANAELLDSGSVDGNEYIFWSYNNAEFNYAILVEESDVVILIGNIISEESAKECFEKLEINSKE